MLHTLGRGTWEVQASFDGTEILILQDENEHIISFRMDDDRGRAELMYWMHRNVMLKRLIDIGPKNDQPSTPHTEEGE